jgi:hypothetical protein
MSITFLFSLFRLHPATTFHKIISSRTLSNLDSLKKGSPKMYLSKNVVYERDSFLEWPEPRLSDREGEPYRAGRKLDHHSHGLHPLARQGQ